MGKPGKIYGIYKVRKGLAKVELDRRVINIGAEVVFQPIWEEEISKVSWGKVTDVGSNVEDYFIKLEKHKITHLSLVKKN
jgi:hypothetical protein